MWYATIGWRGSRQEINPELLCLRPWSSPEDARRVNGARVPYCCSGTRQTNKAAQVLTRALVLSVGLLAGTSPAGTTDLNGPCTSRSCSRSGVEAKLKPYEDMEPVKR